jgi:hypothetical protein
MEEPELLELVRSAARFDVGLRHGHHDTSVWGRSGPKGCGSGPGGTRNGGGDALAVCARTAA